MGYRIKTLTRKESVDLRTRVIENDDGSADVYFTRLEESDVGEEKRIEP